VGTTIEFELEGPAYGTALVRDDDSVWIAVQPRWWDLASWLWWWLCPSGRRAVVTLKVSDGVGGVTRVRTRAVCVSRKFVRVRGRGGF
jgi:hypothetical protein